MANSTWRALANEAYKLAGLKPIDNDASFNDDNLLEKPYMQGKYAVRLAHKHLTPRAVRHFATKRIELPVSAGAAVYQLDTGINPSAIKLRSFFDVTAGGGRLNYMDEDEFTARYPDLTLVPTGRPTNWILLTSERTDASAIWRVRIFPTPDADYDLQYKAQLNAYPLNVGSDIVLWPEEYEHVLIEFAWHLLERGLGEGKEGVILQLFDQAMKDVQLVSGVAEDGRKAVRTMKPLTRVTRYPYNYNRVI